MWLETKPGSPLAQGTDTRAVLTLPEMAGAGVRAGNTYLYCVQGLKDNFLEAIFLSALKSVIFKF